MRTSPGSSRAVGELPTARRGVGPVACDGVTRGGEGGRRIETSLALRLMGSGRSSDGPGLDGADVALNVPSGGRPTSDRPGKLDVSPNGVERRPKSSIVPG